MNRFASIVPITILLLSSAHVVEAAESTYCDSVLNSRAFNTTDYQQSSSLMLSKRSDACSKTYESEKDANSAGRKVGGEIGFKGFSLGGSYAKQTSNEKWSIADSQVCTELAEALDTASSTSLKSQVTNFALNAWSECIKEANKNMLFLEYANLPDGSGFTGQIKRSVSASSPAAFGTITGIITSNMDADESLKGCKIGSKKIEPNVEIDIRINKSTINIVCNKDSEKSLSLALLTDQGDLPFISLPTSQQMEQTKIDQVNSSLIATKSALEAEIKKINTSLESSLVDITNGNNSIKTELTRVTSIVNANKVYSDAMKARRWRSVISARKPVTMYTNSRPYPVGVSVVHNNQGTGAGGNAQNPCAVRIEVGGKIISHSVNNNKNWAKLCSAYATVPPGQKYRVLVQAHLSPNHQKGIKSWHELY